jgi:hypothetical protein
MACSNTHGSCLPWFLSAGWERTKSGIPSRWFQLKNNQVVIICLSDAHWQFQNELTCPHEMSGVDGRRWKREREQTSRDHLSRRWFFVSKIWNSREGVDGELKRGDASDWRRSIDGERLIVDRDEMQSAIVEEFDVMVDWSCGVMGEGRRNRRGNGARAKSKRERPKCVNSCFFKFNFNLFSEKLKQSFVFPCLRIS